LKQVDTMMHGQKTSNLCIRIITFCEETFIIHYLSEFISDKFIEGFVVIQERN